MWVWFAKLLVVNPHEQQHSISIIRMPFSVHSNLTRCAYLTDTSLQLHFSLVEKWMEKWRNSPGMMILVTSHLIPSPKQSMLSPTSHLYTQKVIYYSVIFKVCRLVILSVPAKSSSWNLLQAWMTRTTLCVLLIHNVTRTWGGFQLLSFADPANS